jgi:intracellular septation protein
LHNQRFIQWKPTVFLWLVSAAFFLSFWIGKQPLVQRFLNSAIDSTQGVSDVTWRRLNWLWVVFCAALGALNLAIAFNAPEKTWVNFKVIGLPIVTVLFVGGQVFWLMRRVQASEQPPAQA